MRRKEEFKSLYTRWKNISGNRVARWDDFSQFMCDVSPEPEGDYILARIDRSLPAGPDNFRWILKADQYVGENNPNFQGALTATNCTYCNETFQQYRSVASKFCSIQCSIAAQRKLHTCDQCGSPFTKDTAHFKRFCSFDCAFLYMASREYVVNPAQPKCTRSPRGVRVKIRCIICGKIVEVYPSNASQTTCSRVCYGKAVGLRQQGDQHHNWKGGVTVTRDPIRKHPLYKEWRSKVFTRDKFTCQSCFTSGGTLHAHHIVPYAEDPKKRLKVPNGITLCHKCHREFHVYERKGGFVGLESRLQTQANKQFEAAGFFVFNVHGHGMQKLGVPDTILCYCGLFVAVEYKVEPNFLTEMQKYQAYLIKGTGGLYYMVRSLDDVPRIIDEVRALTIAKIGATP